MAHYNAARDQKGLDKRATRGGLPSAKKMWLSVSTVFLMGQEMAPVRPALPKLPWDVKNLNNVFATNKLPSITKTDKQRAPIIRM